MYSTGIPGIAINTGVPAAVLAVSSTGHGGATAGAAVTLLAGVNLLLVIRAARQQDRDFHTA